MYTKCLIEFVDDKQRIEVIIKDYNSYIDEEDDYIFFYGLSRQDLINARDSGEAICNEWKVIEVYDSSDDFWSL